MENDTFHTKQLLDDYWVEREFQMDFSPQLRVKKGWKSSCFRDITSTDRLLEPPFKLDELFILFYW